MRRLIDADLLKKNCKITGEFDNHFVCVDLVTLGQVVDNQPTVDAVEVVRCKDCMYAFMTIDGEQVKYCDIFDSDNGVYFDKNHFCSYGERKV
jgi:hypothetical protein